VIIERPGFRGDYEPVALRDAYGYNRLEGVICCPDCCPVSRVVHSSRQAMKTKLTERAVARLKPPASGRLDVWDQTLPAFGVQLRATGRRA
jgi:hypothetical protein